MYTQDHLLWALVFYGWEGEYDQPNVLLFHTRDDALAYYRKELSTSLRLDPDTLTMEDIQEAADEDDGVWLVSTVLSYE